MKQDKKNGRISFPPLNIFPEKTSAEKISAGKNVRVRIMQKSKMVR